MADAEGLAGCGAGHMGALLGSKLQGSEIILRLKFISNMKGRCRVSLHGLWKSFYLPFAEASTETSPPRLLQDPGYTHGIRSQEAPTHTGEEGHGGKRTPASWLV